jgi:hypothetical protein
VTTTPRPWQILQAAQARLQGISVADGFRTNAGADVRLEPSTDALSAPRLTLYTAAMVKPTDARSPGEREFTLIIEAAVPTSIDDAHQQVVAIAEDIEERLGGIVLMPEALPLAFEESLFLDRPDGVAAMVAQLMFSTRFRR